MTTKFRDNIRQIFPDEDDIEEEYMSRVTIRPDAYIIDHSRQHITLYEVDGASNIQSKFDRYLDFLWAVDTAEYSVEIIIYNIHAVEVSRYTALDFFRMEALTWT